MNSDVEYTATWVCDGISAESPMDAARKALAMHRDPTSIATVFKVSWQGADGTARSVEIDLTGDVGECHPDILTTPSPYEHLIPSMDPVPERLKRNRAIGCWIDGSRGIYSNNYLLGIAKAMGWSAASEEDAAVCNNTPHGSPEDEDAMREIADEIIQWLNDHVAPEGCYINWHKGKLFCWPVETWCEFTGEPCDDLAHNHP